jgi:thioredoxin reductase (NADPH)
LISPGFDKWFEAAVIGAGPAGSAAAIQLKRYGIEPLVFEKEKVGGLLHNANLVENFPGFPGGITGPELAYKIKDHLKHAGVEIIYQEVIKIDFEYGFFTVYTSNGCWSARRLVLAAGTIPNNYEIPVSAGAGDRVFSDVVPLNQKSGLRVLVVGGGDAAFDYALNIARRNGHVSIINRNSNVKCLPLLWKRVQDCPSIRYVPETQVLSIEEDGSGNELVAFCTSPIGELKLKADYILFAIGRKPVTGLLSERVEAQQQELKDAGLLYLVGDVVNGIYRQTAIAAGDGIRAAMQICHAYEKQAL